MNNKTAIAIIVAVVLIEGCFFVGRHEGSAQALNDLVPPSERKPGHAGAICPILGRHGV